VGIESLGTGDADADVRGGAGFGRSGAHVAGNLDATSHFGRKGIDNFWFRGTKSSSVSKIRVGDRWSVALWWSVSYPASGLASIDESSLRNVS